jgi:hypothetical protein
MTPVDMVRSRFYALPVLLQNFVGKEKDDYDEGDKQKRAQNYVFDHNKLLVVKRSHIHCSRRATDCTVCECLLT